MRKFYFTYGSSDRKQPYHGGWSEVIARSLDDAIDEYVKFHPRHDGLIPCAGIYGAGYFEKTEMYKSGNFGRKCREVIENGKAAYPEGVS